MEPEGLDLSHAAKQYLDEAKASARQEAAGQVAAAGRPVPPVSVPPGLRALSGHLLLRST